MSAARRVSARTGAALRDLKLFETGCGTSGLAPSVASKLPECYLCASDFSSAVIETMKQSEDGNLEESRVKWLVADATSLPLPSASVHVVFAKTLVDCLRTVGGSSQELVIKMVREAHRVLVPGGALVLLDKHGPRLHWAVRCSKPYEVTQGGSRRWYCHELRKFEDCGLNTATREEPLLVDESFRALVVRRAPCLPMKFTTPHVGDTIVSIDGVASDASRMRDALESAGPANPISLRLVRRLSISDISEGGASEWAISFTATLSPPCSPCCTLEPPAQRATTEVADLTALFR